jgi:hypothetical protein
MAFLWDEAVSFALTLPGTAMEKFYNDIVPKVRGKAFISRSREPGSFAVLRGNVEAVHMLEEIDPETFWQSDHYKGWPWVLVREANAEPEMIRGLIEAAWEMRASKAQRAERDAAGE